MANEIDIVTIGTHKLADVVADFNKDLNENANQLANAKQQLALYNKQVKDAEKELEQLNADTTTNTALIKQKQQALGELIGKQQLTTGEVKFWTKEVREATMDSIQYNKVLNEEAGSLDSLRAQLKVVTIAWEKMNGVERASTEHGQALTKQKLALTQQLKVLEQSTGDYRRNVGNYTNSIIGAFQSTGMLNSGVGQLGMSFMSGQQILMLYTEMQEKFRVGTGGAAGGVSKLTMSLKFLKTALISTVIGAIITLLGTLATSTAKADDGFKKLGDEIDKGYFGKLWDSFKNSLSETWGSLTNIANVPLYETIDRWSQANFGFYKSLFGINNALEDTVEKLQGYYKSLQQIEGQQAIVWAKQVPQMNTLKDIINDTKKGTDERKKASTELYNLEIAKIKEAIKFRGMEMKFLEYYYKLTSDPKVLKNLQDIQLTYQNLQNDIFAKTKDNANNIDKINEDATTKEKERIDKINNLKKIIRDKDTELIKNEHEKQLKELWDATEDEVKAIKEQTELGQKARDKVIDVYDLKKANLIKEFEDKEKKRLQNAEIEKKEIELQGLEKNTIAYLEKQNEINKLKQLQELSNTELTEKEKQNIINKYAQQNLENANNFSKYQFENELKNIESKKNSGVSDYEYQKEQYNQKLLSYQSALMNQQITDKEYNDWKKMADKDLNNSEINNAKAVANLKKQLVQDGANAVIGALDAFDKTGKASALAQVAYDTATSISGLLNSSNANPFNSVTFGGAGAIEFTIGMAKIATNIKKAYDIINTKNAKNIGSGGSSGGGTPYNPGFKMPQSVANNVISDANQNLAINNLGNSIKQMNLQVAVTDIQNGLNSANVVQQRITP